VTDLQTATTLLTLAADNQYLGYIATDSHLRTTSLSLTYLLHTLMLKYSVKLPEYSIVAALTVGYKSVLKCRMSDGHSSAYTLHYQFTDSTSTVKLTSIQVAIMAAFNYDMLNCIA